MLSSGLPFEFQGFLVYADNMQTSLNQYLYCIVMYTSVHAAFLVPYVFFHSCLEFMPSLFTRMICKRNLKTLRVFSCIRECMLSLVSCALSLLLTFGFYDFPAATGTMQTSFQLFVLILPAFIITRSSPFYEHISIRYTFFFANARPVYIYFFHLLLHLPACISALLFWEASECAIALIWQEPGVSYLAGGE